jgi:hypothetical protein
MLVLALTILGLSLFSLSGYEAQFFGQSVRRSQAFYDALGGIDRTLRVVSATDDLGAAAVNLPPGVTYARALQGQDSTGTIDWSATGPDGYVKVRVVATRGSENHQVEAWFDPQRETLYEDVIATTGRVFLYQNLLNNETNNFFAMHTIRQNDPDVSNWQGAILGPPTYTIGGVPDPKVADFISYWAPHALGPPTYVAPVGGLPHPYFFVVPGGQPYGVFMGPANHHVGAASDPNYDFHDGHSNSEVWLTLGSGKPVVWLLPGGARFEQTVRVIGGPADRLIIVAGATTDTTFRDNTGANLGLWLCGGLDAGNVPVILVSDGAVAVDRVQGYADHLTCNDAAILAAGVWLRGPQNPSGTTPRQDLSDITTSIITELRDQHLLPNTLPGDNVDFEIVSGSFQEASIQNP